VDFTCCQVETLQDTLGTVTATLAEILSHQSAATAAAINNIPHGQSPSPGLDSSVQAVQVELEEKETDPMELRMRYDFYMRMSAIANLCVMDVTIRASRQFLSRSVSPRRVRTYVPCHTARHALNQYIEVLLAIPLLTSLLSFVVDVHRDV